MELIAWVDSTKEIIEVHRKNSVTQTTVGAANDPYLYLALDSTQAVVGAKLVAANEMPLVYWAKHPDRGQIPEDILSKMGELLIQIHA